MSKILIISPFPDDKNLYPHLNDLIKELKKTFQVDYLFVGERGYFIDEVFAKFRKNPFHKPFYRSFFYITKGIIDLIRVKQGYQAIITIDNFLFFLASTFIKREKIILWSHDIVTSDQQRYSHWIHRFLNKYNRRYLAKSGHVIIQSKERFELLTSSVKIELSADKVFFLPVSLIPVEDELTSLNSQRPILMQMGGINSFRSGSDKLLKDYQKSSKKYSLFFHGFIFEDILQQMENLPKLPIVSSLSVPSDKIPEIVEKCDIGYIHYNANDQNFYHIAFASGQLAEFLRCGKPVICMGSTNLEKFIPEMQIGEFIDTIDELVPAIEKIKSNYSYYCENARKVFTEYYDITRYTEKLLLFLKA